MHPLAQMHDITKMEFSRSLVGLSDEDARKRIEPMNCIGWIIGHVSLQQHLLFVAWANGKGMEPQYDAFDWGRPSSEPSLEEVAALWRASCDDADVWFEAATEDSMLQTFPGAVKLGENAGTLVARNIFHTWCHLGEISAIRQILGHRSPEFVDMHGWPYTGQAIPGC